LKITRKRKGLNNMPVADENRPRCIYKITCLVPGKMGKSYIGQTVDFDFRMYNHQKGYQADEMYIDRAIQYHGVDNFAYESICDCRNLEHADIMEKFFIKFYDTFEGYGYNLTEGGQGTFFSEETRIKMSHSKQGQRKGSVRRQYIGVATHRRGNSYIASVHIERGKTKAKTFQNEIEAAEAYDKVVLYVYGESANLNFPDKKEHYLSLDLKGFYEFFMSPPPQNGHSQYSGVTFANEKWEVRFIHQKRKNLIDKQKLLGIKYLKIEKFEFESDAARAADKIVFYFDLGGIYNFPEEVSLFNQEDLEQFIQSIVRFPRTQVTKKVILYPDRDTLYELVWSKNMQDIGRDFDACGQSIRRYALKQGVPIPSLKSGYWKLMGNLDKPGNFEKCEAIRAANPLPLIK
jgi:group I intron endonuclease